MNPIKINQTIAQIPPKYGYICTKLGLNVKLSLKVFAKTAHRCKQLKTDEKWSVSVFVLHLP